MVLHMGKKEKQEKTEQKAEHEILDASKKDAGEAEKGSEGAFSGEDLLKDVLSPADSVTGEQTGTEGRIADLEAKLKEAQKRADENYDRYLRAVAELDNYRKRAVREKADAINYGNENLIRDMLPLLDGMDRALEHAGKSDDFEAFKTGLQMLREQLVGCMKKHHVALIDSLNKKFDPALHEALMQVESNRHEDNQIVEEFEKGYTLNGRLLRPAKVSVCKNPPSGNEDKNENKDSCF
jgi:molecular chaperone GrpE